MTEKIIIEAKNASEINIRCSDSVAAELADSYTFDIPNAKFMAGYKRGGRAKGGWDGRIRLFDRRNYTLPFGLHENLRKEFAAGRGYAFNYSNPGPFRSRELSLVETRDFSTKLSPCGNDGTSLVMREDQLNAINRAIRDRRSLILSPTSSGKSVISYHIALWHRALVPGSKGLILVPRIQLAQQLYSDWCDYSKSNGWEPGRDVHVIYGGKDKWSDKSIFISTWQSLYELPREYFAQFTYIIGDECHEFKAKSLTYIMNSCVNAWDRTGLTGSLDNTQTHKMVLEGLFGPITRVASSRELMDKGAITKLDPIKVIVLKHPPEVCKAFKNSPGTYEDEVQLLINSEARNRFISNLALSVKGNTLVLFQRVEKHGQLLYDLIKAKRPNNTYYIHGGIDVDVREEIRRIVETEADAIIVASYGTTATGINIRNLHNLIFASPSKARIRNLQSIGRILRLNQGKVSATLFDIADDLRIREGGYNNFTLNHMEERLKMYVEEKFVYKIYPVQLGTNLYA